jgi:hypothetical protein
MQCDEEGILAGNLENLKEKNSTKAWNDRNMKSKEK